MQNFYSRVPALAVKPMFDANLYANIPHSIDHSSAVITEDFENPRMMRFTEPSFIKNGEAYILFAKRGDALPMPKTIPFGVSVIHTED